MSIKKAKGIRARRTACLCLTAVMTASLAAGNALAFAENGKSALAPVTENSASVAFEDVTGKLDLTSIALQNLSPSVIENAGLSASSAGVQTVIVTLDTDCVAESLPDGVSAADYVAGYEGGKALKKIKKSQTDFLNTLSSQGVDYKLKYAYGTVTNAVAISVDTAYLNTIKAIPSVKAAFVSEYYAYPEAVEASSGADSDLSKVYATGIYDSSDYVAQGIDGSGMTVAILDTGLDYTHEAFTKYMPSTLGLDRNQLKTKLKDNALKAVEMSANRGVAIDENDLYVSDKVPFAYDYADKDADVYPSYSQHGTHVAGIVAGHADSYKDKNGNEINSPFYGAAPEAQLVICKVFTDDFESKDLGGATSEDLIAALDDCVMLGVDIINMSLGTTAGFSSSCLGSDDEGVELARIYGTIKSVGISLITAASNDYSAGFGSAFGTNLVTNPDSGTVGSPSTFDGAMSVASINGQLSPYLLANGNDFIFYNESSNANGERYEFVKQVLGSAKSKTFKYVTVNGFGEAPDYTVSVRRELADKSNGPTIAVVQRGSTNFQEKVQLAKTYGADAVIIDNNVAGMVRISLGDLADPIPAISVSQESGQKLRKNSVNGTGVIEVNADYQAGPFMNDYSSWGCTPDLKLKPDITAHGGEITSTVAGGYDEMSGTSMATPNLAGFVALLRSELKKQGLTGTALAQRVNQIIMSTAKIVYDESGKPYSPRKQGAGLATLDNAFGTNAYLYTKEGVECGAEDDRPKIELGEDKDKTGVYKLKFYAQNFGADALSFKPRCTFITESVSANGQAVAESAYFLDGTPVWRVNGAAHGADDVITVAAGGYATVECTLTLTDADRRYLDTHFPNGMFIEGFLQLLSETEGQCDLSLPFMGFYGDWYSAPMLDYDVYELAEYQQDTSIAENAKPQARVWATQAYATYYNKQYSVPLGTFMYVQDENAQQIYADKEHSAISCWNIDRGEDALNNYMTADSIHSLYAGLLRNAELVTYDLINAYTGEVIKSENVYCVGKAYSGGGSAHPAQVKLDLSAAELGLEANGKYEMNFRFYFKKSDAEDASKVDENVFSMVFYVDYEAPILVDSRIRYRDYTEQSTNKQKQSVYLDLDVYDNHYPQSVILCYGDRQDITSVAELKLVTEYITPVYNAKKNGTTTVTIEITDIFDKYKGNLYVQVDDYALNHSVYALAIGPTNSANVPSDFELVTPSEITIGVNEAYKIQLSFDGSGDANASNFTWDLDAYDVLSIKNGEIFGLKAGDATVTIKGKNGNIGQVKVHVIDKGITLGTPTLSFGVIEDSHESLKKATGTVTVNAGRTFKLEVLADNWYYPLSDIEFYWTSDNEEIATVTQDGVVTTNNKRGTAAIRAYPVIGGQQQSVAYAALVRLSVQEPFVISNYVLTHYYGSEEVVEIPKEKNIMSIASEAFKDNDTMRVLIIPKTVTEISERAFLNCTVLEEVYFVDEQKQPVPDSSLSSIRKRAFLGCTALKKVDLSNVKTITLDNRVFYGCAALEEVVDMEKIGTMNYSAFEGCVSLTSADLTGLHVSGSSVFKGCTALETVKTAYYTAIGENMFEGCTALTEITVSAPNVSAGAFAGSGLKKVIFDKAAGDTHTPEYTVGAGAFENCVALTSVDFKGNTVLSVGDRAFAGCVNLASVAGFTAPSDMGVRVFEGTKVTSYSDDKDAYGAIYRGTVLVDATAVTSSAFTIRSNTTEIAAYAFAGSKLTALTIPASVATVGVGAFAGSAIQSVSFAGAPDCIPAYAFAGSALKNITVPASVEEIGAYAFADCAALETVTFAQGARLSIGALAFAGCTALTDVRLPEITGGVLSGGAFSGCAALETAELNNVTEVGAYAFANCSVLDTVTGLDALNVIGAYAFANCNALATLNLASARVIGDGAFAILNGGSAYTAVLFPEAVSVGREAFSGGAENKIIIPASLKTLGAGAFANSRSLKNIEVDEGNADYFTEYNVLYRVISGTAESGEFELCCYPAANLAPITAGVSSYSVLEGTVAIQGNAFTGLVSGAARVVVIPYTVKTIGSGAFYASGIREYRFECINAPVLYSEPYDNGVEAFYSLYYTNFGDRMLYHTNNVTLTPEMHIESLTLVYPSNGTGYDNYVFGNYFSSKIIVAEMIDDTTRLVKTLIEGFMSPEEVKQLNSLAVTAENRQTVSAFSEEVKRAHGLLNTVLGEIQRGFIGEEIEKLAEIEAELKTVKARFDISPAVASVEVDASSSYKREYKTGEKFDKTGLVLLITFDDYSTELVSDVTKINVTAAYEDGLTVLDRYVVVSYSNLTAKVNVHVTENGEGGAVSASKKLNPAVIYGPILGVVAAAGIAVAAVFLVKKFRKGGKADPSGEAEISGKPAEDAEAEAQNAAQSEEAEAATEGSLPADGGSEAKKIRRKRSK